MDHDAMLKDVQGLKKFRDRVEAAIAFVDGLRAAGFMPGELPATAATPATATDDVLAAKVAELVDARLTSLFPAVDAKFSDLDQRLAALTLSKEEAESYSDRIMATLDFVETNREGLELLLSLDGDPDQADTTGQGSGTSGSTGSGGPLPDAGVAAGASASVSGTDGAAGAAQASPAPAQGTDGTGQSA